jgi:hypothetical protein
MSNYLTVFNDHFGEFLQDIQNVFPQNPDILAAKNSLTLLRKANPKMIIRVWNKYIVSQYKPQIEKGDIEFFINKDYSQDLKRTGESEKIMESIDRLREPVRLMSSEDQQKCMKYIQNLTTLADMYDRTNQ